MPRVEFDGDSRDAVKATQKMEKATLEVGEAAEYTTREFKKLEKQAERVSRKHESATEKSIRKQKELDKLVRAGLLSEELRNKELQQYNTYLERTNLNKEKAFGQQALAQLTTYVGGLASLSAGLALINKTFQSLEQSAQAAADSTANAVEKLGALQQLENAPQLKQLASFIQSSGITADIGQAADIAFLLNSKGIEGQDQEFLLGLLRDRLIAPSNAATAIGGIGKATDALNLGDLESTTDKLLATAGGAFANLETVAEATTRFGTEFKAVFADGAEALAAFQVLEGEAPNPEVASTRAKSFFSQLRKIGRAEGTLVETLNSLAQEGDLSKLFGDVNALAAAEQLVAARGRIGSLAAAVNQADVDNLATQRSRSLQSDPAFSAALGRVQAESAEAAAAERYGVIENTLGEVTARRTAAQLNAGQRFRAFASRATDSILDYFGLEGSALTSAAFDERLPAATRLRAARGALESQSERGFYTAPLEKMVETIEKQIELQQQQLAEQRKQNNSTPKARQE